MTLATATLLQQNIIYCMGAFYPKTLLTMREILRLIAKMVKCFLISLHLHFSSLTQKFGREQDDKKHYFCDTLMIFMLPNQYEDSRHDDLLGKLGKDKRKRQR